MSVLKFERFYELWGILGKFITFLNVHPNVAENIA